MSTQGSNPVQVVDQADHHKHMDFVQAIINRLANNSFATKGWSLTVSSALLGFAASRDDPKLALIAVVPALAFWILDTYFLRQERAFRDMYDDVAAKHVTDFKINLQPYTANQSWKAAWSITLFLYHGSIMAVTFAVSLALMFTAGDNGTEPPMIQQPIYPTPDAPSTRD